MRRNIFKYALALTIALSMLICGSLVAFAAGEVTVQVDSVTVSSGETVTAEMTIDGAFAAFQGRFVFDTDALKLEDIEVSDDLAANRTMFNQDDITDEFVDGTFASAGANDISVDGPVFTLTFKALGNASGTYEISIEQFKIFNAAGEALTVNTAGNVVEEETLVPNGEGTNHMDSTSSQGSPIASEVLDKLENNQSGSAATGSQGAQTGDNDNTGSQAAANDDPSQEDESENAGSEGSGASTWVIILIIVVLVAGGAMLFLTLRPKNNELEEGGSEKAEEAGEEPEDKDSEDENGDEE